MITPRPTILVVDDDNMIAGFLSELLTAAGFNARVARGGQEALDRLNSGERDEIDLVLLDVMMPDIDGFTVCRRLRASPRTERLLIIMVTGRDKPAEKVRGLEAGAACCAVAVGAAGAAVGASPAVFGSAYCTELTWLIGIVRVILSPPASVISESVLFTTRPLICDPSFSSTVASRLSEACLLHETIVNSAMNITGAIRALRITFTFPFPIQSRSENNPPPPSMDPLDLAIGVPHRHPSASTATL